MRPMSRRRTAGPEHACRARGSNDSAARVKRRMNSSRGPTWSTRLRLATAERPQIAMARTRASRPLTAAEPPPAPALLLNIVLEPRALQPRNAAAGEAFGLGEVQGGIDAQL